MPPRPIKIKSPEFADLKSVLRGARQVFLSTPFFTAEGLRQVSNASKLATSAEFWVALNVTHWMTGHSDFEAMAETLLAMQERMKSLELRVKGNLHAKLYYGIDVRRALIGSANLTGGGFGGNIEVCAVLSDPTCKQIDQWIMQERDRTQPIKLDDFYSCVELSKDAVSKAGRAIQEADQPGLEDFNAAIDLFEHELVRKMSPMKSRKRGVGDRKIEIGKRVKPELGDLAKILPRGWPTYVDFLSFLRERSREKDARELLERAEGKSNLQGHVKHFFWASLLFFIEHPEVRNRIRKRDLLGGPVRWEDQDWIPKWKQFLEDHDDENFDGIGVSFHTIKVYLPPTAGGTTITGGGGLGNFKRAIAYVREMIGDII